MSIKFGTGGFRGVIGDDFIKENVCKIAQGLSNIAINKNFEKEVVIGYDYRFLSNEVAKWMSEVFISNGIKVNILNSASPSPTVMFLVENLGLDFGVMITASHNPYIFNGVKVFEKGGYDADVSFTNEIEKEINNLDSFNHIDYEIGLKNNLIKEIDGITPFINNILKFVKNINPSIKIGFDNLNGVAAISLRPLFNKVGIKNVTILNENRDPLFRGKMPNPIEANLDDLKKLVKENKLDIGIATDSDADRLGVIDELGNYVTSNEILASIYYFLVKYLNEKGDIVKNCATSNLIDDVANKLGYKCHEVDVGFKNITHTMSKYDCLIGGESSGGLTIRGYIHGKDSSFSIMMFLMALSVSKKSVSELVKEVKDFSGYHQFVTEDFISYKKENEDKIIDYLKHHEPKFVLPLVKKEVYNRNFKYYFCDDQWILIRLSGTEPVFRIFSEMNDALMAIEDIKRLDQYVRDIN